MSENKLSFIIISLACLFVAFSSAAQSVHEGLFVIHSSADPNMVLDIAGADAADEAQLCLCEHNRTNSQLWLVRHYDDEADAIVIKSVLNPIYVITLSSHNFLSLTKYADEATQIWLPIHVSSKSFALRSASDPDVAIDASICLPMQCSYFSDALTQSWSFERLDIDL